MNDMITRTFDADLSLRSAGAGGDGRTIFGIAVPYDVPQYIHDGLVEQFDRGAFNHQLRAANRVRLAREHVQLGGSLIGAVRKLEDRGEGLYFEARVSRTAAGDETLELINDGALRQVSIGFRERPNGNRRGPDGALHRTAADLFEIATVMEGAYGELAELAGVRSRQQHGSAGAVDCREAHPCCADAAELRAKLAEQQLARFTLPELPPL